MTCARRAAPAILLLLTLSCGLLSGCWSYLDVEERAVAVAMGIDAAPSGFALTAQIALPGTAAGGALQGISGTGQPGRPVWVVSSSGATIPEAVRNLQSRVSRRLFWPHVRILAIGDRLARHGLGPLFETLSRDPSLPRYTAQVVVTPSPVTALLSARLPLGNIPAMGLANLRESNLSYGVNLKETLRALLEPGIDPALPLYAPIPPPRGGLDLALGGPAEAVQIEGIALFRGDRLAGRLGLSDTLGFLWLTGRLDRAVVTLPCPLQDGAGRSVSVNVRNGEAHVRALPGRPLRIRALLTGIGEIVATEDCPVDVSALQDMARVRERLNEEVRRLAEAAVRGAQAVRSDPFGFGEAVRRAVPAVWYAERARWADTFAALPVSIEADVAIRGTGLTR